MECRSPRRVGHQRWLIKQGIKVRRRKWLIKFRGDKYWVSAPRQSPASVCWGKPGMRIITAAGSTHYQPATGQQKSQGGRPYWEKSYSGGPVDVKPLPPVLPGKGYKPVVIPNGAALPFKIVDGVKVFHLIAEEVDHAFDSGLRAKCWGYNGRVNSTVIEAVEGERVRIYVTNRLPVSTSVHWHGIQSCPMVWTALAGSPSHTLKPGKQSNMN